MRNSEQKEVWVVYMMTQHGNAPPMSAVCEQRDWEAMELARPGYHTLVRSGITNEAEAESLARKASGFVPRESRLLKSITSKPSTPSTPTVEQESKEALTDYPTSGAPISFETKPD